MDSASGFLGISEGSCKFHYPCKGKQMNFVSRTFETYCSNKNLKTTTGDNEQSRTEGKLPHFPCNEIFKNFNQWHN
jgi:hypothetical protein